MPSSTTRSSHSSAKNDNIRFFDHRREDSRTDWDRDGWPNAEWEQLLQGDAATGRRRRFFALSPPGAVRRPGRLESGDGHHPRAPCAKGLGLHNDLQNESSIVGNFPTVLMMEKYGSQEQQDDWIPKMLEGTARIGFGLTEPMFGTDATRMETNAYRDGDEWVINGPSGGTPACTRPPTTTSSARTSGNPGEAAGITSFIVPVDSPGFNVEFMWWTYNMPTDHAEVTLTDVRVNDATSSATRAEGWRPPSCSCTRTASARLRRASAPLSTASTRR